ncbi:alpha/beta fold hydrolase [Streptomyces sp. NPDC001127]|uniref:alpha/beta hydrolase n=1 Tax=Streptomyces sp. NPDC001127 TaxID=3154377 RepID=UPI003330DA98
MRWWRAVNRRAAIFYIHGIQSHSGWLWETGPLMARHGIEVFALDRRGSGLSGGLRGHLESAEVVLDDYTLAADVVQELTDGCPITAVGQSLGGSILAAMCSTRPTPFSRLIFSAPALGQQRYRHSHSELEQIRHLTGTDETPVRLKDEQYTDLPAYLQFMARDPLMLRNITLQSRATVVVVEDLYRSFMRSAALEAPVSLLLPMRDQVIELGEVRTVMTQLAPEALVRVFPTANHYLEFSEVQDDYWECLKRNVLYGIMS